MMKLEPDDVTISLSYTFKDKHYYQIHFRAIDGILEEDARKFKNELFQAIKLKELVEEASNNSDYQMRLACKHLLEESKK